MAEPHLSPAGALRDHDEPPVAWREAGSGDLIVFLHGLGTTRTGWDAQLAEFSADYRCVAWDMPGYGASPPPAPGPLTFATSTAALVDLLDQLGAESAHVVGLSFGGMHALHLAIDAPERVRSLTLADTSPAFGLDGTLEDDWIADRLGPLDTGETPASMATTVMGAIGGPGFSGPGFDAAVASMGRISSPGLRAAVQCLPTHDVRSQLGSIRAPTLVIVGEHDAETPPAYSELLAGAIPGARLEVIAGAGHLTPLEDPATFNRLVRDFLSSSRPDQSVPS